MRIENPSLRPLLAVKTLIVVVVVYLILICDCFAVGGREAVCLCNSSSVVTSLMLFFNATNGNYWTNNSGWTQPADVPVCLWFGVSCGLWASIEIKLPNNNLTGTLVEGKFAELNVTVFDVSGNRDAKGITGAIPPEYGKWKSIVEFNVAENSMSGGLPETLQSWRRISRVRLAGNSFAGQLPDVFKSWTSLTAFYGHRNKFRGTLPSAYKSWTLLQIFSIGTNQFSGTLPNEYSSWICIKELIADNNKFQGELPEAYSEWMNLTRFRLDRNAVNGSIPETYSAWRSLTNFQVDANKLSGTLSRNFRQWVQLRYLLASANQLSGSLHADLSAWSLVEQVDLSDNRFSGELPRSYMNWTSLQLVNISNNNFVGSLSSEFRRWRSLEVFDAGSNGLSGSLPENFSSWRRIRYFGCNNNRITGTLPEMFSAWGSSLISFELSANAVSGTLPESYARWEQLLLFSANSNALVGTIPPSYFTQFTKILVFQVGNNSLSGALPSQSLFAEAKVLILSENTFTSSVPSQWATMQLEVFMINNNPHLIGALPQINVSKVASVCHTKLCGSLPQAWMTSYIAPVLLCFLIPADFFRRVVMGDIDYVLSRAVGPADRRTPVPLCDAPSSAPTTAVSNVIASRSSAYQVDVVVASSAGVTATALISTTSISLRRSVLIASLTSCNAADANVDVTSAPLQLRLGDDASIAMHVGAVVGDVVLWLLLCIGGGSAVAASRWMKQRARSNGSTWIECAAALRMPGVCVVAASALLQQVAHSSAVILSLGDGGVLAVGVLGLCTAVGVCAMLLVLLSPSAAKFLAVAQLSLSVRKHTGCRTSSSYSLRFLKYLVAEGCVWRPQFRTGWRKHFTECCGVTFCSAAPNRHWWFAADCCVSVLTGVLVGASPKNATSCRALIWVLVALSGLWCVASIWLRPKHRRLSWGNLVFANAMQCVLSVCAALAVADIIVQTLALVTVIVTGVNALVVMVGSWWLRQRRQPVVAVASREGDSLSPRFSSKIHLRQDCHIRDVVCCHTSPKPQSRSCSAHELAQLESLIAVICDAKAN